MGGSAAVISTVLSIASSAASMANKPKAPDMSGERRAREEEARKKASEERRKRKEKKEEERDLAKLRERKARNPDPTLVTGGAGLLGDADVSRTGLKRKLGQ